MKKILFIPLFFSSLLAAEENLHKIDIQGKAFWEAGDSIAATKIYESLSSTTSWQKARILYNLGTIELSQNHPDRALHYFQQIQMKDLSLSDFGKDFALNLGIAYYRGAQYFAESSIPFLEEAMMYLTQSLESLDLAQKLGCANKVCDPDPLIDLWKKKIQKQRDSLEKTILSETEKKTEEKNELIISLKNAITQAHVALQSYLLLLIQNNTTPIPQEEASRDKVILEQQKVVDFGVLFIPAVVNSQQEVIQSQRKEHCSTFPWEQIIPIFDQGMQLAKSALHEMQKPKWDPERIQSQQIETIRDWTHVLYFLQNAPDKTENATATTDFITNARKIQEMFLQDQNPSNGQEKEFHSW